MDEERWRPLHHAAHFGNHRMLALLLSTRGVDVNAPSNKRWRPIDVCTTADAARMLLDAGAVQSSAVPDSLSALHHAAFQARLEVVEVLLARGASVTETFSPEAGETSYGSLFFGGTALHVAASSLACALNLRQATGTNFGLVAPNMVHAPEATTQRVAVCEALLCAGADINALTSSRLASEARFKMSPLIVASQLGDAAVIRALLRAGAHADAVEPSTGWSALHFAAHQGHTDAIYALAAGGADVNKGVRNDRTLRALWRAVLGNHHGAVRALLELGADPSEIALAMSRPPGALPRVVDDAMRALVARHLRGAVAPARTCALPDCEARRRAAYDDKKLMMCPCKVRAAQPQHHAASEHSAEPCALCACRSLRSTAARSTRCWTASATRRRARRRAAQRKPPPEPLCCGSTQAVRKGPPFWTTRGWPAARRKHNT